MDDTMPQSCSTSSSLVADSLSVDNGAKGVA